MKIIDRTKSICNLCQKVIPAEVIRKKDSIFLRKKCDEHGLFEERHIWDDPKIYEGFKKIKTPPNGPGQVTLALTYRCNLNCPVCYARANESLIDDFNIKDLDKLKRYKNVFLTGGEPTVRKDLSLIIRKISGEKKNVFLFTNGIKLANLEYVKDLRRAGLKRVIMQFDSLSDKDNEYMRGKMLLNEKMKAVKNLEKLNIPLILYSVILKSCNSKNLEILANFAFSHQNVKILGLNPLWKIGRYNRKDFIPSSKIIEKIEKSFGIKKDNWIESTRLLCNLDNFLNLFQKRKRYFSKCNMRALFIIDGKNYIPITKLLNTKKINSFIESTEKSAFLFFRLFYFFGYLFFSQFLLNFIKNKNFRIMLKQAYLNRKYSKRKGFWFFSPFKSFSLAIFPVAGNLDFSFLKDCNFNALSSRSLEHLPACVYRIFSIRNNKRN